MFTFDRATCVLAGESVAGGGMLAGRRAIVLSHPSRKKRGLDGAQTIEGELGVKYLTGPPAQGNDSELEDEAQESRDAREAARG